MALVSIFHLAGAAGVKELGRYKFPSIPKEGSTITVEEIDYLVVMVEKGPYDVAVIHVKEK